MTDPAPEQESLPAVKLVRAIGRKDWPTVEALIADDFFYEAVLSDEEIRGKQAYLEFNREFPGDWWMPVDEVVHQGTTTVIRLRFIVGKVVDRAIIFFETDGEVVTRQSDWWPNPYEPPAWRGNRYRRQRE
jgi:hypothetical protein